ncbi:hypothetical protein AMELA_G00073330 [Ameiurus melas]|uniref:Uncharacterized protein n=1 Tax=Ameiurus melas TaxID=219545 RepID=A0A7J6AYA5_AMEME|nr:hypothetical protein AMELA_G00073330 [Ameiurus melas]
MPLSRCLHILSVFLINKVLTELQCCMNKFGNGSVSYTLNDSIPNHWTCSWIKNDLVIVDEEGVIIKDYVESQIENGYILKQWYSNVLCKLESPEDGVSREINCTAQCNPTYKEPTEDGSIPQYIIVIIIILIIILLLGVGFLVYKWCRHRRRRRDKDMDVEIQPINAVDQDQSLIHDPDQSPDLYQDHGQMVSG